jgi:hypothetical protein
MVLRINLAKNAGRKQHQGWAQAFSAAIDDIIRNLVNQDNFRMQGPADDRIDCAHIVGDARLDEC